MTDRYNPKEAEPKWIAYWEKEKVYKFNPEIEKEVYSIDTPPPTVSGKMHIGHAFSYTQQDIIARYKRLRGYNVFYPFGTDDNGLPTEKLIEKTKNVKSTKMERDEFIKLCQETLKEIKPKFIQDWKNIGVSCDFELIYSTIDKHCRKISQKTFLELAKKGLVYRHEAPVIWDTSFQTAIAQAELEDIERTSYFNDIMFKGEDGKDITIGTTRPELLGACVALFAHPEDKRYKHLFGKTATTPIYKATVPILADEKADPEKGTGIVMCCTFGDQTDIEWYKKHNLQLKMVITKDGKMNEKAGKYTGLKIEDARKAIIEDLKQEGLLVKQEQITQTVNVGERSGVPIEIINSKQWYVKYLDKKEHFLKAAKELKWHPDHMKHRLENWIKGLNWDWSISRQRKFGVPIPAWYDKEGNVYYADESQLPVDPLKDKPLNVDKELIPETDVFDTWFTSASTPFLAIELLDQKYKEKLFPMSLRPQAHDIINFWLFYTLAKTHILNGKNPWKEVTISGFVLDPKGQKMSKSKGNVVEPQTALQKYSADALRYWAGGSKLGDDLSYQEKDLKTGDRFVTKLWNASKFVNMNLEGYDHKGQATQTTDKWILTRLAKTIQQATEHFDNYEYARAKLAIESFFWEDYCDNYLELIKARIYEPQDEQQKKSAQYALYTCLSAITRLMAPFTPFITEEVYHLYLKEREGHKSVHTAKWPGKPEIDEKAEQAGNISVAVLTAVRKKKSEAKLSMKAPVKKLIIETTTDISGIIEDLKATTGAEILETGKATEQITPEIKITTEF